MVGWDGGVWWWCVWVDGSVDHLYIYMIYMYIKKKKTIYLSLYIYMYAYTLRPPLNITISCNIGMPISTFISMRRRPLTL